MINTLLHIFQNATLQLPAMEVVLSLAVLSLSLVFRLTRFGLIFAYVLSYRWGWTLFVGRSEKFMLAYLLFGTVTGILTIIGMMQNSQLED